MRYLELIISFLVVSDAKVVHSRTYAIGKTIIVNRCTSWLVPAIAWRKVKEIQRFVLIGSTVRLIHSFFTFTACIHINKILYSHIYPNPNIYTIQLLINRTVISYKLDF